MLSPKDTITADKFELQHPPLTTYQVSDDTDHHERGVKNLKKLLVRLDTKLQAPEKKSAQVGGRSSFTSVLPMYRGGTDQN